MRSAGKNTEKGGHKRLARCSRIKICGLSRPCDIEFVNAALPDYIGFVFAKSRRQVTIQQAQALKEKLDPRILSVGVFVNEQPEVVAGLAKSGVIDMIQLHGQEDEAYLERLRALLRETEDAVKQKLEQGSGAAGQPSNAASGTAGTYNAAGHSDKISGAGHKNRCCPIIQAFSVRTQEDVAMACKSSADYILLDHGAGGTGHRFDWSLIAGLSRPFFLAGGLDKDNLEAAARTGAFALDVSSGVETDGFKDPEKIKACVKQIKGQPFSAE